MGASQLARRAKRHDYFSSALPWPQKGDAVTLPLGISAPIATASTIGQNVTITEGGGNPNISLDALGATVQVGAVAGSPRNPLYADLSEATAVTINELRQAFQIQRLQERDARSGTRYTEVIRAHFGVVSPDARLQRPEFLGGGTSPINIHPVAQTSSTDATTPKGNLSGFGTVTLNGHGFTKSFTEHCIIIGLVNVRADLSYQRGLERMWSRRTKYDYYWPALAQLGEQTILNKEIYSQGATVQGEGGAGTFKDDEVFGYQERYAEYRYKPSYVTGRMRSVSQNKLDAWHLSLNFSSLPGLNNEFIEDKPQMSRVLAVATEPEFIFDAFFKLRCARPMPLYGIPGMVDHF